jgi:hypothetical protein
MAKPKKDAEAEAMDEPKSTIAAIGQAITGAKVPATAPAYGVPEILGALDVTHLVDDLIIKCPTELDYKLRTTAEQLEAQAARLRAEWRRRRGE